MERAEISTFRQNCLEGRPPSGLYAHTGRKPCRPIVITDGTRNAARQRPGEAGLSIRNPQLLRGDLDNIVLMAMRKEPSRRYESAAQFSADIQRHLDGLPVVARKDTWSYRTEKFVRRNKLAVAAAAVIALTLVGAMGAVGWQARVATMQAKLASEERDVAQRQKLKAERINRFLQRMLSFSNQSHSSLSPVAQKKDVTVNAMLDQITPLAKDDFARALRQQVKESPSKDLFIFVHGFNNTFEDAARRAAQMVYDLDFDGTPILYSWPSQGSATAYAVDEAAVGISGRKMADFLETVVAQSGAERIHLLAHSMGNRALIEALQTYLAKRAPEKRQHIFGQIVFTAPDVDRDYFTDAIDSLRGAAERVTLYASVNDYALRTSQYVHGAPRAGTAGDVIIRLPGLDTIDMSAVPADALGHSYFAANSGAIYDIFRILWRGDPPQQRCGMSDRKGSGTLTVWWFNADACKGDDLLEAGVMLKRFGDLARARVEANISTLTDPSQIKEWKLILKRLDGLLAPAGKPAGGVTK
jgi:pimeloyl-ACP methyl ester carboxylesterase